MKKIIEFITQPEVKLLAAAFLGGVGVVTACRATLELEDIIDEHKQAVEEVKDNHITLTDKGDEILDDTKVYRKELTGVYISTGAKIGRQYALTALIFALTATLTGLTYKDIKSLKKENLEAFAALKSYEAILNRYRDYMREKEGEEAERQFYNGISTKDIEVTETDDKGKEKKKKVKGAEVLNNEISGDAFIFDESCGAYVGHDIDHNMFVAERLAAWLSDKLKANGSLVYFEIRDEYGIDRDDPRYKTGAFVKGCLAKRNGGASDDLTVRIRKVWVYDEMKQDYIQKILVDPHLDGIIVGSI